MERRSFGGKNGAPLSRKIACKQAPTRETKNGGHRPPPQGAPLSRAALLLANSRFDAGFLAFQVGDAAFLFDVFVELLSHIFGR